MKDTYCSKKIVSHGPNPNPKRRRSSQQATADEHGFPAAQARGRSNWSGVPAGQDCCRRPRGVASRPLGHAARCPGSSPARRPGSKQRRRQQVRSREQKRISRQQAKQKAASQRRLISQFDSTSLFPNWSSCNAHLFFLLKLDRLIVCYIQFSFPLINCILHITCLIYLKCPTHLCKLRFSSYL